MNKLPGLYTNPGTKLWQSTKRIESSASESNLCKTASFSIGFKEQVEYTIFPFIANSSTPRLAILY